MRCGVADGVAGPRDDRAGAGRDRIHVLSMLVGANAMSALPRVGQARARCPLWWCGLCRGGTTCRCVPFPAPRDDTQSTVDRATTRSDKSEGAR